MDLLFSDGKYVKIGVAKNPEKYGNKIAVKRNQNLEIVFAAFVKNPYSIKEYFLSVFSNQRVQNEWFEIADEDIVNAVAQSNFDFRPPYKCNENVAKMIRKIKK